jgi:hypothetical protein
LPAPKRLNHVLNVLQVLVGRRPPPPGRQIQTMLQDMQDFQDMVSTVML